MDTTRIKPFEGFGLEQSVQEWSLHHAAMLTHEKEGEGNQNISRNTEEKLGIRDSIKSISFEYKLRPFLLRIEARNGFGHWRENAEVYKNSKIYSPLFALLNDAQSRNGTAAIFNVSSLPMTTL